MATGVQRWSKTAGLNSTADTQVNWQEGQAPSSINDSSRAEMSSVAKWRDDISGTLTTGGSSTAYTITTNQSFTADAAGMSGAMLCFIPHVTSGLNPTLAVDGLTARQIRSATGSNVATGALIAGTPYQVTYIPASTEFILMGYTEVFGNATVTGTFGVTGATTFTGAATFNSTLSLKSTDAGATQAPTFDVFRDSASPAAADVIGAIELAGRDSAGNKTIYARLVGTIADPNDGTEDGAFAFQVLVNGSGADVLHSSGADIAIPGALAVTGAVSTAGNVAVNTNKFTVLAANGNTAVAGTITGADAILSTSPTAGIGYSTGAGGTVTQATNKSTGVTLNKASGAITMNNASLAADGVVAFTLTNSAIAATDVLVLNHISGGTIGRYKLNAGCGAGSATITVHNSAGGPLSDAIVIQFAVIKGVNA